MTEKKDSLQPELRVAIAAAQEKQAAAITLLDFGGFIVHVFTERARHYYDLERLWRAARRVDFTERGTAGSVPGTAEAER